MTVRAVCAGVLSGLESTSANSVAIKMFRSGVPTRRIREDGYATNDRTVPTMNPGKTSSVAVPIMDRHYVAGTLTLSYFASTMTIAEALRLYVEDLRRSAAEISRAPQEKHQPVQWTWLPRNRLCRASKSRAISTSWWRPFCH